MYILYILSGFILAPQSCSSWFLALLQFPDVWRRALAIHISVQLCLRHSSFSSYPMVNHQEVSQPNASWLVQKRVKLLCLSFYRSNMLFCLVGQGLQANVPVGQTPTDLCQPAMAGSQLAVHHDVHRKHGNSTAHQWDGVANPRKCHQCHSLILCDDHRCHSCAATLWLGRGYAKAERDCNLR